LARARGITEIGENTARRRPTFHAESGRKGHYWYQ